MFYSINLWQINTLHLKQEIFKREIYLLSLCTGQWFRLVWRVWLTKSKFIQALYEVDYSSFGSLGRAEIRKRDFFLVILDSQHPIARYLECRWSPTMTSTHAW